MTVRIAHLSDPHFGTVMPEVSRALTESLRELHPDLVLMSGDITQRARRWQFRAARDFKHSLKPIPAFAIPGNHDIPLFNVFARLLSPYGGFHSHFQDGVETDIRLGDVRVVGLNSTSRWRHTQGSLDISRIEGTLLDRWDGARVRIAAVHHPLDCAKRVDDKNLIREREQVFELFERAAIDLVVSGHVHDPFVTLSNARYPATKRAMILSVAGTCLSWRTRKGAPNSFNLLEIETDSVAPRITVTRMDLVSGGRFFPRPDCIDRFERSEQSGWVRI